LCKSIRWNCRGDHQLGVGAIIGAAAGGLLGSFVGQGHGARHRDGRGARLAVGLSVMQSKNRYVDKRAGQHVTVRLQSGVAVAITQPADPNLRVGDRVSH
jgi:outer membrane lipoprotein SlyB